MCEYVVGELDGRGMGAIVGLEEVRVGVCESVAGEFGTCSLEAKESKSGVIVELEA